jgi:hypothetical protein
MLQARGTDGTRRITYTAKGLVATILVRTISSGRRCDRDLIAILWYHRARQLDHRSSIDLEDERNSELDIVPHVPRNSAKVLDEKISERKGDVDLSISGSRTRSGLSGTERRVEFEIGRGQRVERLSRRSTSLSCKRPLEDTVNSGPVTQGSRWDMYLLGLRNDSCEVRSGISTMG